MIGKEIAHYRIDALLGAGGMGEVYQARDTRLGRNVAVKLLPEVFASDPDRVARFEREAKLLASLNHANIAALYGMEQSEGRHFLVMELVEGETLTQRIARGPIPAKEAFGIAHQITEALEAAHEKGVIHRDLKPANVKITPEGKVKVLDFGLAKALGSAPGTPASNSPTLLSAAASNAGVILGTAGYMSPEQARGQEADQRSDIFSFGCVLYEMIAGRQTFPGETVTDIIASIVARDPDFRALPASLHPRAEELIRRCLAKNRKERWHAIADVRVELNTIMADPHGLKLARIVERPPLWKRAVPAAAAALIAAAAGVALTAIVMAPKPSPPLPVARFSFSLPEAIKNNGRPTLAISPDGTNIAYLAGDELYLRQIGNMEARPLAKVPTGSLGSHTPFISPDGQWVGFYSRDERKFKKVAITGGAAVTICDAQNPYGASWSSDGQIYIGQGENGILRVSENGGQPVSVVTVKPTELAFGPEILPGGDSLMFTLSKETGTDRWDKAQIVIQSMKSGVRKILIPGGSDARYVPTGHIVYALGATLFAIPFDVKKLQTTGGPVPVLEGVARSASGSTGAAHYSFSSNGSLVYIPGDAGVGFGQSTLALVDRAGNRTAINMPAARYVQARISPNGKQLALDTNDGGNRAVLIYDLSGSAPARRLTFGGRDGRPTWSRDGQRVVFTSDREGDDGLFWQRADVSGAGAERLVKAEPGTSLQAESWSPDGRTLIFSVGKGAGNDRSLSMLTLGPNQAPAPLIGPPSPLLSNASLSPDGHWLAYHSSESGHLGIYVQHFPPTGEKYQITTDYSTDPVWSPDGRQLFFLKSGRGRQITSVDVQTQPSFKFGKATPLPIEGIISNGPRPYDISPDGKYFVVILQRRSQVASDTAAPEPINIVLNWFRELQERVPVK